MTGITQEQKLVAKNTEKGLIFWRNNATDFLGLTSIIGTYQLGYLVTEQSSINNIVLKYAIIAIFVYLAYMALDFGVRISLSKASLKSIDKSNKSSSTKIAIAALLTTCFVSLASSSFVKHIIIGESKLTKYEDIYNKALEVQSKNSKNAMSVIAAASKEEKTMIKAAKAEKEQLIKSALGTGHEQWIKDYNSQKHLYPNKGWFWTCEKGEGCPSKYIAFRKRIKTAIKKGDSIILAASTYEEEVKSTLSGVLNTNLSQDSSLMAIRQGVMIQETERKDKQSALQIVFFISIVGSGILAFLITMILRQHRDEYGHQVVEDNLTNVLIINDFIVKVKTVILDFTYTLIFALYNYLKKNNIIKQYAFAANTHIPIEEPIAIRYSKKKTSQSVKKKNIYTKNEKPNNNIPLVSNEAPMIKKAVSKKEPSWVRSCKSKNYTRLKRAAKENNNIRKKSILESIKYDIKVLKAQGYNVNKLEERLQLQSVLN